MMKNRYEELGKHPDSKFLDWMIIIIIIGFFSVLPFASRILYFGDWDFWVDWKDKLWWPIVGPTSSILVASMAHYLGWKYFKLPVGATAVALLSVAQAWLSRTFSFYMLEAYPLNFVWPSTTIPLGMILDLFILWTRSYLFTSVLGGFLWGFLFYPVNWLMLWPFLQPVSIFGKTFTVADYMGYYFVRPQTPEYLRRIDQGTLQAFIGERIWITTFTAGVFCPIVYWLGVLLALLLVVWPMDKVLKQI